LHWLHCPLTGIVIISLANITYAANSFTYDCRWMHHQVLDTRIILPLSSSFCWLLIFISETCTDDGELPQLITTHNMTNLLPSNLLNLNMNSYCKHLYACNVAFFTIKNVLAMLQTVVWCNKYTHFSVVKSPYNFMYDNRFIEVLITVETIERRVMLPALQVSTNFHVNWRPRGTTDSWPPPDTQLPVGLLQKTLSTFQVSQLHSYLTTSVQSSHALSRPVAPVNGRTSLSDVTQLDSGWWQRQRLTYTPQSIHAVIINDTNQLTITPSLAEFTDQLAQWTTRLAAGFSLTPMHSVRRKKTPLKKYQYFQCISIFFYEIFRDYSGHNLPLLMHILSSQLLLLRSSTS